MAEQLDPSYPTIEVAKMHISQAMGATPAVIEAYREKARKLYEMRGRRADGTPFRSGDIDRILSQDRDPREHRLSAAFERPDPDCSPPCTSETGSSVWSRVLGLIAVFICFSGISCSAWYLLFHKQIGLKWSIGLGIITSFLVVSGAVGGRKGG